MASIALRSNKLVLDFRYNGVRCREQTALTDSKTNRAKLLKLIDDIEAAIRLGRFVYADFFPGSPRSKYFAELDTSVKQSIAALPQSISLVHDCPLFSAFTAEWLDENESIWKASHCANVNAIFEHCLLPAFGSQRLDAITRADILKFRSRLTKTGNGKKRISND